ncbi:hypothetical protein NDU88_000112 [Pleurodeles waltl]|uniref:Uncharacterized protein n=1 Tax=Pleurodeles waltl TaxID=8319 RepID=A0AAV7S8L1_PLEWA|nr:hypothetical protein NDU88_000112 [Pleurodeles waltl]
MRVAGQRRGKPCARATRTSAGGRGVRGLVGEGKSCRTALTRPPWIGGDPLKPEAVERGRGSETLEGGASEQATEDRG